MVEQDAALGSPLIEDLPYIKAEVLYACRHEMAMTPEDVLARRTSIQLEDRSRGIDVLHEVADTMSQELGWPQEQRDMLVKAYQEKVRVQLAAEKGDAKEKVGSASGNS